ncbi:tetratricopeptide repeat protein [Acinetobacter haemolyticus]|uniref:tetratricopeptide repeat protein n=1 Tax=Acinetobacter haemolyticus TaxID=29430 RepID=UPI003F5739A2
MKKHLSFLKKAAELGNPEAQYNLGVFFEQGVYVKKDKKQAEYWYEKAAKQGHLNAINNLNILRQK